MSSEVTEVVRRIRDEWITEYGYTPQSINRGDCLTFANEVVAECDGVFMKRTGDNDVLGPADNPQYDVEPHHVWVSDGTLHYDSEAPEGVSSWRDLPFFKRTGFGPSE